MKGTKARTVNTLGMFDLFKGIGMATVIFVHTAESYSIDLGGGLSVTSFLLFIYREALMSAFYIASGYGFRKRSVGKCVQQQLRGILPPFLYTALATAGLHLFLHHHFFGSWEVAVAESEKVLAGFLLGLPHTSDYFGMNIFSCGPMWYLLTMAVGWIILDILFNAFPERYIPCAVAVTAILGWGTCLVWELPFCLSQGMTVVPYLYLGHIMKKRRWLEQPRLPWLFPAAAVCMAVSAVGSILSGATDNMSMGEWTLGPVGIFVNGVIGLWIITLFVRLGSRCENALTHFLDGVGRRSLHIFCLHTVELIAVPWYLFAAQFAANPIVGLLAQYLLRCTLIAAGCLLLELRKRVASPRTRKARLARRQERVQRYVARH